MKKRIALLLAALMVLALAVPAFAAPIGDKDGEIVAVFEVTCRTLNVRQTPSTAKTPISKVHRGEKVFVVSTDGNWAKILWNDGYAYVHMDYIAKVMDWGTAQPPFAAQGAPEVVEGKVGEPSLPKTPAFAGASIEYGDYSSGSGTDVHIAFSGAAPGATVYITMGSETYTFTADETGSYSSPCLNEDRYRNTATVATVQQQLPDMPISNPVTVPVTEMTFG